MFYELAQCFDELAQLLESVTFYYTDATYIWAKNPLAPSKVRAHIITHLPGVYFPCPICPESFAQ